MAQGTISLQFNKPFYLAGEIIQGTVTIVLAMPVVGHSIKIRFKGFERTMIENTYLDPIDQQMKQKKYKSDKTFFKQESVLYQIGQVMNPGTYNYPFSYQLPAGLPGVFYDERKEFDGDKIKAAIMYKVKVYLDVPGKDLKRSERIIVSEALCRSPVPVSEHKEKGFLFSKGKLKMDYAIFKNVFVPGENVPVQVKVDNESGKKVNHIKVKLMRDLRFEAEGFVKKITEEISRESWPGVAEKSRLENTYNFPIKPNVFPSTNGNLVRCGYHLDIECDVPLAPDLEHHVPVVIALLPACPGPLNLYASYTPHAWQGLGWGTGFVFCS